MDAKERGLWIATKRERLGISQGALAERVGVDRSHISHIESGRKKASAELLGKIISALDLPVEELLGDEATQVEKALICAAFNFQKKLCEYLTLEQVTEIMQYIEQMNEAQAALMSYVKSEPMPAGPEGWLNLSDNDKKLVQRIINRLHKNEKTPE